MVDRATESDLPDIERLAATTLPETYGPDWFLAHMRQEFLVARDVASDEVVGFAVAEDAGACEARLSAVAVERFHRRRGVGSALLRHVQADVSRHGAFRMSLEAREDDDRARAFYLRHGFLPAGLLENAYRDGANAVRYERPL